MRALRLGLEGGVGTHFFYQFETDFSENDVDIVTAFIGWRNRIRPGLDYDLRAGHLFNDRGFEGSTGSDSTPFMERTVVATAIIPQRGFYGVGIMPRLFWKTGHASLTLTGDRIDGSQAANDSRTVLARAPGTRSRASVRSSMSGCGALTRRCPRRQPPDPQHGDRRRFNGALRVSTGTLIGGRSTTGYGAELGGYVGPVWVMAEAGERRAPDRRPPRLSQQGVEPVGRLVRHRRPAPYNPRLGSFGQPRVLKPIFEAARARSAS
jgi:phosphate-selective porin OprO/OprP